MSSSELPKTGENRAKDSSETRCNITYPHSLPGSSRIQTVEQQSAISESKTECESATLNISLSASKPAATALKESKLVDPRDKDNFDAFVPKTTLSSVYFDQKPHSSKQLPPDYVEDSFPQPDSKTGKYSIITAPPPFKEFSLSLNDLPLTKQKIDELSLPEACGFFTNLLKTKRVDLKTMENDMDQVSIELQTTLRNAKNICIQLENAPNTFPDNMNEATVQAQKLMYLLSNSSFIFEKLYQYGSSLQKLIRTYSKQAGDFHGSVDLLLEYIMEAILEKCSQLENES